MFPMTMACFYTERDNRFQAFAINDENDDYLGTVTINDTPVAVRDILDLKPSIQLLLDNMVTLFYISTLNEVVTRTNDTIGSSIEQYNFKLATKNALAMMQTFIPSSRLAYVGYASNGQRQSRNRQYTRHKLVLAIPSTVYSNQPNTGPGFEYSLLFNEAAVKTSLFVCK